MEENGKPELRRLPGLSLSFASPVSQNFSLGASRGFCRDLRTLRVIQPFELFEAQKTVARNLTYNHVYKKIPSLSLSHKAIDSHQRL